MSQIPGTALLRTTDSETGRIPGRGASRVARIWLISLSVVAANLVIRGLWVSHHLARPVSDFATYYGAASRWAADGGFTLDGEHATVAWPPGWPFLLRMVFEVTGPSVAAGGVVQVVLSSLTAGVVVLLALRAFGSLRIAALAGALFTLQPAGWARDSVLGTEPLFTLLLCLGLLALLSPFRRGGPAAAASGWPDRYAAALAGIAFGLATLVRGTALFAFLVVGLVFFVRQKSMRNALLNTALAGVAVAVVLTPWAIRNATVTGEFVPVSSNLGQNLWQGTRADVGYWWSSDPRENPVLQAKSEVENDGIGRAAAWDYWRTRPWEFVVRAPVKIAGLYAGNDEAFYWLHRTAEMTGPVKERWKAVSDLAYWFVMAFGLVGAVLAWRRYRHVAVAFLGIILYTTLVFTFFLTWDRFRAPLMPLFCILAAVALCSFGKRDVNPSN